MRYLYPRLSKIDLLLFRIGGSGLGNILFTYARAVVYAQKYDCKVIWPTWSSFKIGAYVRHEKDKRFYGDLFQNNSGYISGIKKAWVLLIKHKITEEEFLNDPSADNCVVELTGFKDCFAPIMQDYKTVKSNIEENLRKKNRRYTSFDTDNAICLHIRLGDFTRATWEDVLAGKHNSSIPVEWYAQMIHEVRRIVGRNVKAYIFSDGEDSELQPVLSLENVERITFGNAISDMLALSRARLFIASGSSFSMWARYLGRMTTIMFPNQVKQQILQEKEETKEIVALDHIESYYDDYIRSAVMKKTV